MDLTGAEIETLARVAALIIPASAEYGLPGADDARILADMARSAARDSESVRAALAAFDEAEDAAAFRRDHPGCAARLQTLVALAYYRDPRVLRALGAPARAPFPEGYDVEPGDETLLAPVRARGPIWRPPR